MAEDDDFKAIWQIGVFDAHCHPTDILASIQQIPRMQARALTVMSTRAQDQNLVEQTAHDIGIRSIDDLKDNQRFIIPAFGWHPWFSHLIHDDPSKTADEHYRSVLYPSPDEEFLKTLGPPRPLSEFLAETEQRLLKFPFALVGEVGLDRSFRIPSSVAPSKDREEDYTPGSREGRPLTPYKVAMEHQKLILKAQLELAAKYGRAVSVHSVQAHGVVFETMQSLWKGHERPSKRAQRRKDVVNAIPDENEKQEKETKSFPYPPRICMHSFSGPAETLKMFLDPKIPADIYISFSECINFNSPSWKKAAESIRMVPEDRILIESDLHCAGVEMDKLLESIVRRVCEIKGWELVEGAKILKRNWLRFIFG